MIISREEKEKIRDRLTNVKAVTLNHVVKRHDYAREDSTEEELEYLPPSLITGRLNSLSDTRWIWKGLEREGCA